MKWYEKDLEIRYADTDQMGLVHHGVYVLFCEVGRIDVLDRAGFKYHKLEERGFFLVVGDLYCRYKAPARYGDSIYIRSAITNLRKCVIEFEYEIRNRDTNALLFTGTTKLVATNAEKKITNLPEDIYLLLKNAC